MVERDEKWRLFDLHYANFQSISKAQDFYVRTLVLYLGLVWAWRLFGGGREITIDLLGASIHAANLWLITPLVLTAISLALVGALNAMGASWRRLKKATRGLGLDFYFTDIDTHKNALDYFGFLTVRPEKKIQLEEPSSVVQKRFSRVGVFIYPSLLAAATTTTYISIYRIPNGWPTLIYVWLCVAIQLAFSLRVYWRAICGFLHIRINENELM